MPDIRMAVPEDAGWIEPIWDEKTFWQFSIIWWRYWHGGYKGKGARKPNEFWWVIEPYAFAHFLVNQRTHVCNLYEIAVAPDARRQGYGRQLLDAIALPITLKTDADNAESNPFYRALGFHPAAVYRTQSGKEMVIYERPSRDSVPDRRAGQRQDDAAQRRPE